MLFKEVHPNTVRTARNRRGPRMNSRVPVSIEWQTSAAKPHFETGYTRVINLYGCLLVSAREMELGQSVRVTNLATKRSADGLVVWKGIQRPDGWDLGVEFAESDFDFWGVDL